MDRFPYKTKREEYTILRSQLDLERSSFISHWKKVSDYILPRRARFTITDVNRGERRNTNIVDCTGTLAKRTLASGMMAGITSPARPWKKLTTPDPDLSEHGPVKDWLYTVNKRMDTIFLRSNLYNVLPMLYGDVGCFATAAIACEEDMESVMRFSSLPIGSYMISVNEKGQVDTVLRDFRMTVRQLISKFGERKGNDVDWSNFSAMVKRLWEDGHKETWVDVCHVVKPNPDWDPNRVESKFNRYESCYFERGSCSAQTSNYIMPGDEDKYLREEGYNIFPIFVPRWETTGEDSWGTDCPGMTALGDILELQAMKKRKSQAVEKMVRPPLIAPSVAANIPVSSLPGDISYIDIREGQQTMRPLHEVNPRVQELMLDIQDARTIVSKAFYEDLFLMMANSDRRQITAREIDERHEEKLLALGPVLEQLNQDLLDPLIDTAFVFMMRQGLIPPPPQELQGLDLRVEYVSIMSQAQKLASLAGLERYAGFAAQVASVNPESMDKTNWDEMLDEHAEITSVRPSIIRSDDEVAAMRQQRAQAQQAQAQAQMLEQGAGAARDLSQADLSGDNALSALLKQPQGALVPA